MAHLSLAAEVEVRTSNLQKFARQPKVYSPSDSSRLTDFGQSSALRLPFNLQSQDFPYLQRLQVLFPGTENTLAKMYGGPFAQGTIRNYDSIIKKFEATCQSFNLPYPDFSEFSITLFFHQSLEAKESYNFFQSMLPALSAVERSRGAEKSAITPFIKDMKNSILRHLAPNKPPVVKAASLSWENISYLYVKECVETNECDWDKFNLWQYESKVDEPIERAYSMANYPDEKGLIMLNVRVASPPPGSQGIPPG